MVDIENEEQEEESEDEDDESSDDEDESESQNDVIESNTTNKDKSKSSSDTQNKDRVAEKANDTKNKDKVVPEKENDLKNKEKVTETSENKSITPPKSPNAQSPKLKRSHSPILTTIESETLDSLEKKIHENNFEKQLHKWGNHHHLPEWAEKSLVTHVEHEIQRKKQMQKYAVTCKNVLNPCKWCKMWHQRHLHCKGDIKFPTHQVRASTPSSNNLTNDDEVQLTEELIHEILEDKAADSPIVEVYEKNGLKPINEWTSDNLGLKKRNEFFTAAQIHENRIRSIALANPKPSDSRPGKTRLNTKKRLNYDTHMKVTVFNAKEKDPKKNKKLKTSTQKLKDYMKKSKY